MSYKLPHVSLLFKRLLLVYTLFSICRLLFFIFNFSQFAGAGMQEIIRSFAAGLLFDTSAIVYTFSLFILLHVLPLSARNRKWYQSFLRWIFTIVLFFCVLFNLIDSAYYPFSARRSGKELFLMKHDVTHEIPAYIMSHWYLALILLALVFLAYRFYPRLRAAEENVSGRRAIYEIFILFVVAGLCLLGARGGWQMRPITGFDAARFADVKLVNLTINTPFNMLVSVQQVGVDEKHFMEDAEALRVFNPVHRPGPLSSRRNIVLIIVESLGKEYVGYHNSGKGYTPFLDSLMSRSTVYTHAYANGKRSIEGIPSIIASMASFMNDDYNNSIYQSNSLRGIGSYLQEAGYDASFYHGGKNGTMGFDNFVAITNSGEYFGMNEYPEKDRDYDGDWGIYDEPYLQYFAGELSKKKEPFFSTLFTLSSHHPYNIPAAVRDRYPEGSLPIHKTIRYTDHALRRFFESAKQMPWYRNTLFIITADHSAENQVPQYQTFQGQYEIPYFEFDPSDQSHAEKPGTFQQISILPHIVGRFYPGPYFSFGSLRDSFAVQYFAGVYQLIRWPFVFHFTGDHGFGLYDLSADPLIQKNIIETSPAIRNDMEQFLKAYIQQYNHALIANGTHVREDQK